MRLASFQILSVFGVGLILSVVTAVMGETFVVTTTVPSVSKEPGEEKLGVPEIYQMHVKSDIRNRFALTTVTSRVRNYDSKAREATFAIVIPEAAYISGFIMEIDDKNYTALVKEKEEAQRIYDQAISSGLGAAQVSARDSNRFVVSVNIEPKSNAAFYLNYEQLLMRKESRYEQVINIHTGQFIKDLSVEVSISESRNLIVVRAPPLRSGNEIPTDNPELDPQAVITIINGTSAVIKFSPSVEQQKEFARLLGTNVENGFSGQFVIQYDVERDPTGGEVLIQDGYFVHFFAPTELQPLPKQVVFVLDTSGSMSGQKVEQLKRAMLSILEQLNEQDSLNLVEFNTVAKVWDIDNPEKSVWYPNKDGGYCNDAQLSLRILRTAKFPRTYPATAENIKKAKSAVSSFEASGSTGMYGALQVALRLVEIERVLPSPNTRQPLVMFLTDGQPTDLSTHSITTKITEFNTKTRRAPIFALSFGDGADKKFLQKLAILNFGFSRHIYDAADASLQLQDFYRQIASPLLYDVTFKYEPSITSLTKTKFPIHFGGSEIVVAGFCGTEMPVPVIDGIGPHGPIIFRPIIKKIITSTERLWAYISIKQILEQRDASDSDGDALKMQALNLALKYKFVTPVSSLVVVKPNNTNTNITTEPVGGENVESDSAGVLNHLLGINPSLKAPSSILSLTTPMCIITTNSTSPMDTVLDSLPWLGLILDNELVKTPEGSFKLGLNVTISDIVSCPNTPLDQQGHCALLHMCPEIHSALDTSIKFFDHFCILNNEFAGVCCPNK